mmetsp:Transcript_41833/g.40184  ORF Transcript_41833/g.40184 Transcript_41833/m.40184 type:complete len:87 (-) Transcript_41833:749-1009(-)|eukprot:CAMPEP_0170547114 /NCGR_PEP_ID=MMETSP0211-20121228/5449_1 /TAXON_ID=311385 /ORGANISM="Pseudokeronopsis sp., Strain OXSARD2" /LENGTH=86 /DNA_ID=CAMNT_0010851927 /DNA_START=667 /DNA_END=927 /DNA_ORIENTATION=+
MIRKSKEKKGLLTYYISSLSEEQLMKNTLTGYLINLLKEKGAMKFEDICEYLENCYHKLRKPGGSKYESDMKKALRAALSANGIFE